MKHLLIIFSLLLTSVSWSKDINFYDLVVRDDLYYEKFTDKPFTGNVTGIVQSKMKNGKWKSFFEKLKNFLKTSFLCFPVQSE